jgi:ribosome-binding factor A
MHDLGIIEVPHGSRISTNPLTPCPMPNLRHERVRELLKREIGEAIRREFHVNEAGLISVNDIDMAGDLKSAVVFISIFGNAAQQKRGLQLLTENRVRIQGLVARSVVLKYTPTLKFVFDDSIVRGNRVLQIIEELEKTQTAKDQDESK